MPVACDGDCESRGPTSPEEQGRARRDTARPHAHGIPDLTFRPSARSLRRRMAHPRGGEHGGDDRLLRRPVARRRRPVDRADEHNGSAGQERHCGEHEPWASLREEKAREGRCDEDAQALDPTRDDVRRRQLVRCSRKRRHEGGHRRPGDRHLSRRDCRRRSDVERRERQLDPESTDTRTRSIVSPKRSQARSA